MFWFKYSLGEEVFHRLAQEYAPGYITGLFAVPNGIGYCVTWGDMLERAHYELELTTEYIPRYGGQDSRGRDDDG